MEKPIVLPVIATTRSVNPSKFPTGNNRGLQQAYEIRDIAAQEAIALRECPADTLQDKATRARALRDCVSVWDSARDAIRVMRGRPLPGSLRPEKAPKKTRHQVQGPVEAEKPEE